jgi:hypothetical protein
MLVGSMASNYWGVPRSTHALDFVVHLRPESVDALVHGFASGFFVQPESVANALSPPYQFNALDEESALKVGFWTLRADPFEQSAFVRRLSVVIFDTPAFVATPEDLILHKLYWHKLTPSERQLRDAAGVYRVQRNTLDTEYLKKWAGTLDALPDLRDVMSGKISPKTT